MDHLASLPEGVRTLALDRFRLIQPHLDENQSLQSVARAAGIRKSGFARNVGFASQDALFGQDGVRAIMYKERPQ
jgi:hypothetical protein